ncbi:MAG: aldo/keto reductase [bacterium]|nr:aldo/keto reductase [bacterium]
MHPEKPVLDRREFLQRGTLAGLSLGLLPLAQDAGAQTPAGVRRYKQLGRTDIRMSDISFGGSRLGSGEEDLVHHALDLGVNYFDSAESYTGGESEKTIGNALRGKRDKVYLTSKTSTWSSSRKEQMMETLEKSLRSLRTDYVDVYFNHAVNNPEVITNPEWHEFNALAKKQGKIRYTGISGHAGRLISCLDAGMAGGVDVFLVAYNFGQDPAFFERFTRGFDFIARQPALPAAIKKAKSKGIGIIAMKVLYGGRLNDMRPYEKGGATYAQAAFRWVLSNPDVDSLIISMTSRSLISEYVGASGWRSAAREDFRLLKTYAKINGASFCRQACDACEGACPKGVSIPDVLRTRMYARGYGDMRLARSEYAMLGAGAEACLTCESLACAGACPFGLKIEQLTGPTHRMLSGRA